MYDPMDASADQESDDGDAAFVEMDPFGRYGRYNKVLGKGAFKTVYWAFDELEGMEVAWNQVKVRDVLQQSENLERMYAEVHLLKTLKHKNILKFYTSWVDTKNKNINVITEIFTSGTLRQYRRRHKRVDMRAVKNWSRQILRGLLYLHSHDPPIIHRDLKCDNIFVNGSQGEVKIGDLGLAVILRQAHAAHSVVGTPEFMAPELYEEEYNELVDIYSFGMCLLEILTFEYPYSECANAAQIYKKVSSGIKPAALDKVKDPTARQFVEKCLATVSRRLPARELLMDPFLQIEGKRETMDFTSHPNQLHSWSDGPFDLRIISEEPSVGNIPRGDSLLNCSLPDRQNFKRVEIPKLSVHSNAIMGSFLQPESVEVVNYHCLDNCLEADIASPTAKQECMRGSRDFQVKGKRKDGNTIFLRLRIADSRGLVRNIHFPFDIEIDTALCVASEMVAELDLSDQDVTAIGDMIDVEIEALVPQWKPGLDFEDNSDCCQNSSVEDYSSDILSDGDHPSGVFVFERLPSGRMYWSQSPMASADEDPAKPGPVTGPAKFQGLLHGTFEELTHHQSGSSSTPDQFDEINFSSESDFQVEDADDLNTGDYWASQSYSRKTVSNRKIPVIYQDKEHSHPEILKSTAGAEVKSRPSNLQIRGTRSKSLEDSRGAVGLNQCEFAGQLKSMCENQHGAALWEGANNRTNPLLEGDRRIAEELENLALQQQHELEALKKRHQQALEDLKNRLCQRGCTVNPSQSSLSTTVVLQDNFPINCSASFSSESKSGRLSLNEIAAFSARFDGINDEGVSSSGTLDSGFVDAFQETHHQTSFGESNILNHGFGMQVLPQKHRSISSSRLGAIVNAKAEEQLPHYSQDDRSTRQLPDGRPKLDRCIGNSTPYLSEMNVASREGLSNKPLYVDMGVRNGTGERNKEPSEQVKCMNCSELPSSLSRRHSVDANLAKKVSLEEIHSVKSIFCKEMENAFVFKDMNGETGKSSSKFGLIGRDEATGLYAASSEQKISNNEPRQLLSVKSGGPLDCSSVADSVLNMETNHLELNAPAARNALKASVKSCANSSSEADKLGRRQSYIGFYKGGASLKDKPNSFQGNGKISDQGSTRDLLRNLSKTRSTDKGLEQLKKQQLQKSIAELEAKTIEGLGRSRSAYLVNNSAKKQSTSGSLAGRFRSNDSTTGR